MSGCYLVFDDDGPYRARRLARPTGDALFFLGHHDLIPLGLEDAHGAGVNACLTGCAGVLIKCYVRQLIIHLWNPVYLQLSVLKC